MQTAMLNFHAAGLAGKHGVGVRFLVSNAFSHGACMMSWQRIASIQESFWQFQSFVQYVSMSEEQRKRQGMIVNLDIMKNEFFTATWILQFRVPNGSRGSTTDPTSTQFGDACQFPLSSILGALFIMLNH
jgi:hypothetical protein